MQLEIPPAPDRSLLAEVASGNVEALRELVRRHSRTVYALAYGILVDASDADDVVKETFDYARHRAAEFIHEASGSVFPWLTAIARSRAHGMLQARAWPDRLVSVREPESGYQMEAL